MRYNIEQVAIKPKLTLAKVTVLEDDIVILQGEQIVCLPTGAGVVTYIEDVYLIDQRRQPDSVIAGLDLPYDAREVARLAQEEAERLAELAKVVPPVEV
jgi:hypothetical protein